MSHQKNKHNEQELKEELQDTGKEVTGDMPEPGHELDEKVENAKTQATPEALLAEEKERYLRLYSEFDNFKKRSARERMEFLQVATKDVILSMLSVLDDMERALKASENLDGEAKKNVEGFELIYKKMLSALESRGLKAIVSMGKDFDVELHEAVTKIAAPSPDLKGKVVDELEKGYSLNDKVIRFAKVVIGE